MSKVTRALGECLEEYYDRFDKLPECVYLHKMDHLQFIHEISATSGANTLPATPITSLVYNTAWGEVVVYNGGEARFYQGEIAFGANAHLVECLGSIDHRDDPKLHANRWGKEDQVAITLAVYTRERGEYSRRIIEALLKRNSHVAVLIGYNEPSPMSLQGMNDGHRVTFHSYENLDSMEVPQEWKNCIMRYGGVFYKPYPALGSLGHVGACCRGDHLIFYEGLDLAARLNLPEIVSKFWVSAKLREEKAIW